MRIDRARSIGSGLALVAALTLAAALVPASATAQTISVDEDTQVRAVAFDIRSDIELASHELETHIAALGRGGNVGLRKIFGWMPFVPAVEDRFFDPVELQRDKERLRRFMATVGYPEAVVDYEVTLDEVENLVDIVFIVVPGRALAVRRIAVAWTDSTPPRLDPDSALAYLATRTDIAEGRPLDRRALAPAAMELGGWLTARGRAFASVRSEVVVDSVALQADVRLVATVGPRARIGSITVEGASDLPDDYVLKFARVAPGDWFSTSRLRAAGQRLATLDVVGSASFEVPEQPVDTTVDVVVRVNEQLPRDISGQVGYSTEGGLGGSAQWTHRSIFGRGQTLVASLSGQSGVLALPENSERFVRSSLTLRQPLRSSTQLTLHVGPFAEYRDDHRDRSLELGLEATLVYQLGGISSIALRHELSTRRIFEYRFGGPGGIDLFEFLELGAEGILDQYGARINTSISSLSATFGSVDSPSNPRRGFTVHPTVAITFPGSLTSREFFTSSITAAGYLPVSEKIHFAARVGAGKLIPFGKSVPASQDEGLVEYFRLRDALFTAGGMSDVRGWSEGLLGPKVPQIILEAQPDSTVSVSADRYSPVGGFNRFFGNLELRLPLPPLGDDWGSHIFADGGQVWTDDERFTDSSDPYGVEGFFWSLGGGIDYNTPVGAIRLAVAYKMNPSIFDLVEPGEFLDALLTGTPFDELPQHAGRRFHFHIGVGRRL